MSKELIGKVVRISGIFVLIVNFGFNSCLLPVQAADTSLDMRGASTSSISTPLIDNSVTTAPTVNIPSSETPSTEIPSVAIPSVTIPSAGIVTPPIISPESLNKGQSPGPITGKIQSHVGPPFKIAGSYNALLQRYTGATSSSEFLTDLILYWVLKKEFGGKVKVRVKTYSFTDLWHLKVRKAKMSLTGSHYKDIPLGKVFIESQTPFWFAFKHNHLEVMHAALFSFKMQISEKELDKILHSPTVTNSLHALRLDLAALGPSLGEQRLQMHSPEVTLEDDLVKLKVNLATQGGDPSTYVPINMSGQPVLHGNDRVYLEKIQIDSPDISEPEKFSRFVENLINPLINLNRFDKPHFALRLDEISIKDKTVTVSGRVILGPRVITK